MDQLEPLPMGRQRRLGRCVGSAERTLDVVEHRKELGQEFHGEVFAQFAPFTLHALPVVVELGLQAQQSILRLVAVAAKRLEVRRPGLGGVAGGLRRRVHVRVVHEGSPPVTSPISTRVTAREALSTAAMDRE